MTYLFPPVYNCSIESPISKIHATCYPLFFRIWQFFREINLTIFFFFCRICQRYIAVREPHRHSYKKVVDVNYDAICENGKICKKTRQEYQTIYRTVYRTTYKCASNEE